MAPDTEAGKPVLEGSAPYLGRSVRVVGPVEPPDPANDPNAMAARGELGKAIQASRSGPRPHDPFKEIFSVDGRERDPNNCVWTLLQGFGEGSVNPVRTEVADPAEMSRRIKRAAKYLGVDLVGIARVHPAYLYKSPYKTPYNLSGRQKTVPAEANHSAADLGGPEEICRKFPFAITLANAWDYDLGQAHRHTIADIDYHLTAQKRTLANFYLGAYIRELGYRTVHRAARPQAVAIAAGLGELGRNGLVVTEKFGSRVHLSEPILTDLPLVADKPIDIGVDDFCRLCKKCATTCPSNSIPHGGKVVVNGVEKYQVKWKTCYGLRAQMNEHWETCLTCTTVCPYSKRDAWWHTLATWTLKRSPITLRPPVVRTLKLMDDLVWGRAPRRRVQWMGYDSGIPPASKPCSVPGCTAHGEQAGETPKSKKKRGYYAPLRENTNRFVR